MNMSVTNQTIEPIGNAKIAMRFRHYADRLEQHGAEGYRTRAYRVAATEIDALREPLADHLRRGGIDGLIRLRGIGKGIAAAIAEMLNTGPWRQLNSWKLHFVLVTQRFRVSVHGDARQFSLRCGSALSVFLLCGCRATAR